jgi:TPR repeat protein
VSLGFPLLSLAADAVKGIEAYERGDYEQAVLEWGPLADMGDAMAQLNIGLLYMNGEGLPKNATIGANWVRRAADQQLASAERHMAELYMFGNGVEKSSVEAEKWYRRAAQQQDPRAQLNMGALYSTGKGVEIDFVEAYKWFSLAAAHGQVGCREAVIATAEQMSQEQIERARDMVAAFEPTVHE